MTYYKYLVKRISKVKTIAADFVTDECVRVTSRRTSSVNYWIRLVGWMVFIGPLTYSLTHLLITSTCFSKDILVNYTW